ncbi:MAG: methyl-accepting chemotaxis protein [Deltaproteobacteria bacterium]|nr:methyl-accepting chemotaxis protein [Deltaproteobacteria bacterium]
MALPAILLIMGASALTSKGMVLLVGGVHLLNGLLIASLIGRTVGFPAGQLENRMREVSEGRLNVRARVFGVDTFGAGDTLQRDGRGPAAARAYSGDLRALRHSAGRR